MSSGRKFSVKRHLQNRHNGKGMIIPFVDYLAGRRDGKFLPRMLQSDKSQTPILRMLLEEIDKDFARKVASKVNAPVDDPGYEQVASVLRTYKRDTFFMEIIKEFKDSM